MKNGNKLQNFLLWIFIFFVMSSFYLYKNEFFDWNSRMLAELIPGYAFKVGDNTLVVKRDHDGHFYINASINDHDIRFLVDTGASKVMLSHNDAQSIGIDVENLKFDQIYQTANGNIKGASTIVSEIKILSFVVKNISISVTPIKRATPLLGISLLNLFDSYTFDDDNLYLKY